MKDHRDIGVIILINLIYKCYKLQYSVVLYQKVYNTLSSANALQRTRVKSSPYATPRHELCLLQVSSKLDQQLRRD